MSTPLQELLSALLGQPLRGYVKAQRKAGRSWDVIAGKLSRRTGREVNGESLRRWFA